MYKPAPIEQKALNILMSAFSRYADGGFKILFGDLEAEPIKIQDFGRTLESLAEKQSKIGIKFKIAKLNDRRGEDPHYDGETVAEDQVVADIKTGSNFKKDLEVGLYGLPQYWISKSDMAAEFILNDKYILAKPNYDSVNESFMEQVYRRPNLKILKKDLRHSGKRFTKDFHTAISDLNFNEGLQNLFFPGTSSTAVFFRNPVYAKDMQLTPAEDSKLKRYIKKLRKKSKA